MFTKRLVPSVLALLALFVFACVNTDAPSPSSSRKIDDSLVAGQDSPPPPVALFNVSADSTQASDWGREFIAGMAGLPQVTRHAVVRIDWSAFSDSSPVSSGFSLGLNLFPDFEVTAGQFEIVVDTVSGVRRERWTGIDRADSLSELILARYPDSLFLYLTYPRTNTGLLFSVYHVGNGVHVILDVDKNQTEPGDFAPEQLF